MTASVFDIFTVGIGPSSSHTVGPMRAAGMLVSELAAADLLRSVTAVQVELYGALGATGRGHATDRAILAGLAGAEPETVAPATVFSLAEQVAKTRQLTLASGSITCRIDFPASAVAFRPGRQLPYHPNALVFNVTLRDATVLRRTYYSVGGGFVAADDGTGHVIPTDTATPSLPRLFSTGADLLAHCAATGESVAQVMLDNEVARGRTTSQVYQKLDSLWDVMSESIRLGCDATGDLPGGLAIPRRAHSMVTGLMATNSAADSLSGLDWVSLWAIAVGEQNAAGGRIVTAPTNGAAGIVPAVLRHSLTLPQADRRSVSRFLLTAGAVGAVFQASASISGAEVGCQGEIGVASSMAAAGLCAVMGGTPQQVLNAAEIGLEHHLGLTCDPVGGLVQVPCIERNAMGAVTAITAARLALTRATQFVTLDQVIVTMMATGADMKRKYKETSQGGLALSLAAC
ncbi:MAG: L-serine ammonia-lyase [Propionibacteriaceae bacterium]|nr:L-serine ammonia-lyase [Propionibacteriaceae bacterium]